MFSKNVFFFFLLLHSVHSHLQINLHLTDWPSEDNNIQHDCLQVSAHIIRDSDPRQILSYCMGEWPSAFHIRENTHDQKLTFEQLAKLNVTNQQLYSWSAPIDLIEEYQIYLHQLSKSSTRIFYNCTAPYFGSQCQYLLEDFQPYHSSLDEIVHDYYRYNRYEPTLLTCYVHLECDRGPSPSCLTWREICDGKVDCLDGDYDEEHCWQMEMQTYDDNEHSYHHHDCISEAFYRDDSKTRRCFDKLDPIEMHDLISKGNDSPIAEPTFEYEDISCAKYNNMRDNKLQILLNQCEKIRIDILSQALFSMKPKSLSDECWTALKCIVRPLKQMNSIYSIFCADMIAQEIINKTCPDIIQISAVPLLFGRIYVIYKKYSLTQLFAGVHSKPTSFCYDNHTCHSYDIPISEAFQRENRWIHRYVTPLYQWLRKNMTVINKNAELLDKSMLYKCPNQSKYISKYRLLDAVIDCQYGDDEKLLNKTCPQKVNMYYFKCETTNECIPKFLVDDGQCDCTMNNREQCDDQHDTNSNRSREISFQTTCDEYIYRTLWMVEDRNEIDCEHWPLIHIYNRCDGYWHRPDGSDEIDCDSSPPLKCPTNHHICVSPNTSALMCLPIKKANDGIVDCMGAADETALCRNTTYNSYPRTFFCYQEGNGVCAEAREICDDYSYCDNNEEEQICSNEDLSGVLFLKGLCTGHYESDNSDVIKVLCRRFFYTFAKVKPHFTLDQWPNLIQRRRKQNTTLTDLSIEQNVQSYQPRCHRGLNLQVQLDREKNRTRNICLCPPSYYGEICQYQNQRVSLTVQLRVTSDSVRTPFVIIVSLMDESEERIIHSYEQFTYLSIAHCQRKFNIYLLYSTRPKDETKDYFIHIDIYEKETFDYRGSAIKSLNFSFLPVHRVALQVDIPHVTDNPNECSDTGCINGKCQRYFNDRHNRIFCQCHKGWFGRSCSLPYNSSCSPGSLSLGQLANNRSLCVCPLNKIGPRCFIDDATCQNTTCSNGGECVPVDEYQTSGKKFVCLCPRGFTGDQCEINRTQLTITFAQDISLPSSILIHFIEAKLDASPIRTTTFKTVPFGQDSIVVYWSLPFHLVFIELENKTYYFTYMEKIYNQSQVIKRELNSSDRCFDTKELFDERWANDSLARRIKSYHLPCQRNRSQLKCFYDEIHLCLCQQMGQQYVANCFEFDHHLDWNCSGKSGCENEGQCFQEQTSCPRVSVCRCRECYYGARCQFSTSGFSLSLDAILGYHIRPNLDFSQQPVPVLISLVLTLIITLVGCINGTLSLITFQNKITRESGCGIYLLSSSVIGLLMMILFLLKFVILLLSQMNIITNRSFLTIQCYSMDFLLRFCLTMSQWLTAFVGIERVCVVKKRTSFNQKRFRFIAKWLIGGLVLISFITNIHDPIYRRLLVEGDNVDDEERVWCVVQYPSSIRIVNSIIDIFHFIVPFIINFISAVIIIVMSTRQQAAIKKKQEYAKILNEQIEKHKNLLIGPCVLIILGIPRLIISFTSGCMKSVSDSWLFLMGYFISLIPPLLTFVLFVIPSSTYKQAFRKAISRYRNFIRKHW